MPSGLQTAVDLSIVSTLYRSADTVEAFCARALAAADARGGSIELVLVDDGSPDDSRDRALALQARDPRIVVVELSRNFGHHRALMTGLAHARGERVFLLDSDLEEAPEWLADFAARMAAGDCDVVYGVQHARRGGAFERIGGALFFKLTALLSDEPLPRNLVTARLMSRAYVRALLRHRDRDFVIAHLWRITGFRQVALPIDKIALSPTTYTLAARVAMAVRHVTTTSTRLLYAMLYIGLGISAVAALVIAVIVARYVTHRIGISGYTSLIVSIWFFGGLTTTGLGILGIYLAAVLSETRRRPYVVIRAVHRRNGG